MADSARFSPVNENNDYGVLLGGQPTQIIIMEMEREQKIKIELSARVKR